MQDRGESSPAREPACPGPKTYWTSFCRGTPIHGMKYLVESDRPLYERLWWLAVLLTCLYFATVYSLELWLRLTVKPTDHTTQVVSRYENVAKIPFPALTICDNMKTLGNLATSFLCGQETKEEETDFNLGEHIYKEFQGPTILNSTCTITSHYLDEFAEYESYCDKMFTKILTQHGLCYSFNMLDTSEIFKPGFVNYYWPHNRLSDWSPGKGYKKKAALVDDSGSDDPFNNGPFPKRALSWVIDLEIVPGISGGNFCAFDKPGIKLALHNPVEMPRIGHRNNLWLSVKGDKTGDKESDYEDLESGNEYYMDIDPEYTWTNKVLRYIPPNERHCYFHGEKNLIYFHFYTLTNCENECLINATKEKCGCVDFYMPHDNKTQICTKDDMECMFDAADFFKKRGARQCACYPSCKHLKYNADLYYKRGISSNKRKGSDKSIKLTLYIIDSRYVSRELKKFQAPYFLVDFVANCGGVFGLFCGMSIVSLVEFVYYGTLRVISDLYIKRKTSKDPECS